MPQDVKSSYTDKQQRQAAHIEAGYARKGVGSKREAKRAALVGRKLINIMPKLTTQTNSPSVKNRARLDKKGAVHWPHIPV